MKAFVLNLKRSPNRRAHMTNQLLQADIDYHFLDAVDGTGIDTSDTSLIAAHWAGRDPSSPRVLGCSLSHIRAYQAIASAHLDVALILEDDVLVPANLNMILDQASEHLDQAEVLLLHLNCPRPPSELSRVGAITLSTGHTLAYPMTFDNISGGAAYVVTREACERLADALLPVRVPADDWPYFYSQHLVDRIRCAAPLPVIPSPKFASIISHGAYSWRDHVYHALERVPVPPATTFLAYRRARYYEATRAVRFVPDTPPYFVN